MALQLTSPFPNKEIGCHRTGFEKNCFDLVSSGRCNRWIQIAATHPQTGEAANEWGCIDNFGPWLMIENAKLLNQVGAAVESFRNEMVKLNNNVLELPLQEARRLNRVSHTK